MGGPKPNVKSFEIPKRLVYEAWEKVQANGGAPGVDAVSITMFKAGEADNLYKLWNRMSAGSYMPSPVRAVEIPKDHGAGVRTLGVPNVADRVAQTAVARLLEERLEPIFHPDSYGYRPGRSAHDALAVARKRCWRQNWVLDLRAEPPVPVERDARQLEYVPHRLILPHQGGALALLASCAPDELTELGETPRGWAIRLAMDPGDDSELLTRLTGRR